MYSFSFETQTDDLKGCKQTPENQDKHNLLRSSFKNENCVRTSTAGTGQVCKRRRAAKSN